MMQDERRVMSGTWGELWMDGDLVAECYGFQAKVSLEKETIYMCGNNWAGHKVMNISGTGSVRLQKVSSFMAKRIAADIRQGKDPRFVIISKLADPDAFGAERVAVKNVSFDDLTLADWESHVPGKVECPFTFRDFEYLDMVVAGNE